jgi:hypothetical protein
MAACKLLISMHVFYGPPLCLYCFGPLHFHHSMTFAVFLYSIFSRKLIMSSMNNHLSVSLSLKPICTIPPHPTHWLIHYISTLPYIQPFQLHPTRKARMHTKLHPPPVCNLATPSHTHHIMTSSSTLPPKMWEG